MISPALYRRLLLALTLPLTFVVLGFFALITLRLKVSALGQPEARIGTVQATASRGETPSPGAEPGIQAGIADALLLMAESAKVEAEMQADAQAEAARVLAALPEGRFRRGLLALDEPARRRVLAQLVHGRVPGVDHASLRATREGDLWYACELGASVPSPTVFQSVESSGFALAGAGRVAGAGGGGVPIAAPPVRHSRPGSARVLYLDFNGHTLTGTQWNAAGGVATYVAKAYDTDGEPATFSAAEQAVIVEVWERVAEDFAPFEIDVTTEEPPVFGPTTGRALITSSQDANGAALPAAGSGGAAWFGVFGNVDYATVSSPCLIYNRSNAREIADSVSHEFGHNLGLSHDGWFSLSYYTGHGTGATSWAPIMGVAYNQNISQWSKGDYYGATNFEDDLEVIAGRLGRRPDDAGDTIETAALPALTPTGEFALSGVMCESNGADLYTVSTGTGIIDLAVSTYQVSTGTVGAGGGNLDVSLELLDVDGDVVASATPEDSRDASLSYAAQAGTYHIRVKSVGAGSPGAYPTSGYTSYGSLGQYSLGGTIIPTTSTIISADHVRVVQGFGFSFAVRATNSPSVFSATGLPAGWSIDAATGRITGTPGAIGDFPIDVKVVNAIGESSAPMTFTVIQGDVAPTITRQPTGAAVNEGTSVTLSVGAEAGTAPVSFQWRRNGADLAGETGSRLDLPPLTAALSGDYDVVVFNALGSVTSQMASVTIVGYFPILADTGSALRVVAAGQPVSLTVSATSSTPLTYQWFRNGRSLLGAVAATCEAGVGSAERAGAYWVEVTNAIGTRRSPVWFVTLGVLSGRVVFWGSGFNGASSIPVGIANPVALSARSTHVLALQADGTVAAWGNNASGQCNVPVGLRDVVAISAGSSHSLALKANGMVAGWGYNSSGQVSVPSGLGGVIAIATGHSHSLALKADGTVVAWGAAGSGQTVVPAGLSGIVGIAAGDNHSLALRADGTVVAWGANTQGECNVPAGLTGVVALAGGSQHSLALKADGTVVGWGTASYALAPSGLGGVVALAAGPTHSMALKADGALVGWGLNSMGQLNIPSALGPSAALAAGNGFSVVVRDPSGDRLPNITTQPVGKVVREGQSVTLSVAAEAGNAPVFFQWRREGAPLVGETANRIELPSLTRALGGDYDVLVFNELGTVTSQVATVTVTDYVALGPALQVVAAGQPLVLSTTPTGGTSATYQWFHNGQPLAGATAATYSAAAMSSVASGAYWVDVTNELRTQRSAVWFVTQGVPSAKAVMWGNRADGVSAIPTLVNPVAVSTRGTHVLALQADGTVVAWGSNTSGQCNPPAGLRDVVAVSAAASHSLALRADGSVVAWGGNSYGQLLIPEGLGGVIAISAGLYHSLALKEDGTVIAWGWGGAGQISVPAGLSGVVRIAAGDNHSLALRADGTVVAWGANSQGQCNVPADLADVVAITGGAQSLALKSDGSVVGWGTISYAQPPARLGNVIMLGAGTGHSLALKADGMVEAWGTNGAGQLNIPHGLSGGVALSAGNGFSVLLRDAAGDRLPTVTSQPQGWSGIEGGKVTLSVSATAGGAPIDFQWRRNGVAIPKQTGASLVFYAIEFVQGGTYDVVATSVLGSVVSHPAEVVLTAAKPVIRSFVPALISVPPGRPFRLSATADAPNPELIRYQWYKDGLPIAGATTPTYERSVATLADTGIYWVAVENSIGSRRSALTRVGVAPTFSALWAGSSSEAMNNGGRVVALAASAFALRSDGAVTDTSGTVPAGFAGVQALAIASGRTQSSITLALKSDGTVTASTAAARATIPAGLSDVWAIATGADHSLALKRDGTVVSWGGSYYGQWIPSDPGTNNGIVGIAAGTYFSLALKADGTVSGWGLNDGGQINVPAGLSGVVAITAGVNHALALKADCTVVGWGANAVGQITVPAGLSDVVAIAAGNGYSLALKRDGTVVEWGGRRSPVPAGIGGVFAVAASTDTAILARAGTAGFAEFQARYFTPTQIANLAVAGVAADFDADGLPNLLEHAFDLDPTSPNQIDDAWRPVVALESGVLTLSYIRNHGMTDCDYTVQVSSDLISWQSGNGQTRTVSTVPLDVSHSRVVASDGFASTPDQPRFIRLVVSKRR